MLIASISRQEFLADAFVYISEDNLWVLKGKDGFELFYCLVVPGFGKIVRRTFVGGMNNG